ncbi:MAG: hypothetical protein IJN92_01965 [Lachnospiraceae bacterium]|nr:hypothetical protein [Lachnospiraceae bacterium]
MFVDLLSKKTKKEYRVFDFVVLTFIIVLALGVRLVFIDAKFPDYIVCLKPWVESFKEYGGFKGLAYEIGNYTPAYMHFLMIFSYFHIEPLYLIKGLAIFMDFILAFVTASFLTKERSKQAFITVFAIVLMIPTVITNSGVWGQCDNFYTTFIIMALFFSQKDIEKTIWKNSKFSIAIKTEDVVMFFIGIAFSFKLQTVFVLPVLVILFLKKRWRIISLLWVPFVYIVFMIPSVIAGRGVKDLLTIYFRQTGDFAEMTLAYPNIYDLWQNDTFATQFSWLCMLFCGMGLVLVVYYLYNHRFSIGVEFLSLFTCFSVMFITYFLPHMHDRYGYIADILSVYVLLYNKKKAPIPFLLIIISMMTYARSLLWFSYDNMYLVGSLVRAVLILYMGKMLTDYVKKDTY